MEDSFRLKFFAMLGLCFVLIMVALDQTVIGTAMPTVVAELNGFDLYAWVGTAYLLTSVITVPIFGKLGDEYGRKPFVVNAIILFTLASMLCGMAQDMLELVLARALQGVGGGMLVITAFASVPDLFPEPRERLRWQVLFSSAFGLANAVGPSIGGYLTQYWGWRWVFFVNLPVGLLSLLFVWRYLPRIRHSDAPPSPLDWQGSILLALALGSLQLLIEWFPQGKPLPELFALALLGIASLIALIYWELKCENPVLPLAMLTHRSLVPLFALSLMMGFSLFAVMYYAPLLFQGGFGLPANEAGLLVTPLAVSITIGSIVNGRIVTRLANPNRMLHFGLFLFCLSAFSMTRLNAATAHSLVAASMMAGGLGLGLLMPNLTLFVQATAPRAQLGVATAMLQSTRMIGGMLGTALIGVLVSHRYAGGIEQMLHSERALQWGMRLKDPQMLVNKALASKFLLGHLDAAPLLSRARAILVDSIHASLWIVVALLAVAFWVAHRVPPMSLQHKRQPSE